MPCAFHRQQPTLRTRLLELHFDLSILELDDLLLTLVHHAANGWNSKINVRRRKSSVSDAERRNLTVEMGDSESLKSRVSRRFEFGGIF